MRLPEDLYERELYILERAEDLTFDWVKVTTKEGLSFWTSGDALKLDGLRVPVTARLAQAICDLRGFVLPTSKLSDVTYVAAEHISATPLPISSSTDTSERYNALVDSKALGKPFVRTVGKDWIVHPYMTDRVAVNYGMHDNLAPYKNPTGLRMWQTEGTRHSPEHQDYSQVLTVIARLVSVPMRGFVDIEDLMLSHVDWHLVSYTPLLRTRYVPLHAYEGIHVSGKQPWTDGLNLPAVVLKFAQDSVGIHETQANRGPWVDRVIEACGLKPPQYWCAAAASEWLYQACIAKGIPAPIPRIAGALRFGAELIRKGVAWVPGQDKNRASAIIPGAFFTRTRPEGGPGSGHIGVLEEQIGEYEWQTIEGNVNDAVSRDRLDLRDKRIQCIGHFGWAS